MREKVFDIQRRVVAHKTVESWETIPHAGLVLDLDVTEVIAFTEQLRSMPSFKGIRVTMNSVMLKIIAESIKESPDMNAELCYSKRSNTGKMRYRDGIDIAVPMLTSENRMITPIVRDVGNLPLHEVCIAMEQLKQRAHNTKIDLLLLEAGLRDTWERLGRGQILAVLKRLWANFVAPNRLALPPREERRRYSRIPATERLTSDDLLNATTLVSNVGSIMPHANFHGVFLEIIPPQLTAMVLAGVQKRPVVIKNTAGEDTIAIRNIMPLTFYLDHRALDFEHIMGFLKRLRHLSDHPSELLDGQIIRA